VRSSGRRSARDGAHTAAAAGSSSNSGSGSNRGRAGPRAGACGPAPAQERVGDAGGEARGGRQPQGAGGGWWIEQLITYE
jgi:hypothetical protein